MTIYINTYECHQRYGGPEEGGWWYEVGEPVQSVAVAPEYDMDDYVYRLGAARFLSGKHHHDLADLSLGSFIAELGYEQLREEQKRVNDHYTNGLPPTPRDTGYGGYTFVGCSDTPVSYLQDNNFRTVAEEHFAEAYPSERPHYC